MAHEIVMPQLSLSMDQGQIVGWLKKSGDRVQIGDVLLEVESDKATVEVESVESGILQIVREPGDGEIAVGTVIAYMLAEGEAAVPAPTDSAIRVNQQPKPELGAIATPAKAEAKAASGQPAGRRPSSPAARRRAAELGIDWKQLTGTGRGGRIKERDVLRFSEEAAQAGAPVAAPAVSLQLTPLARRVADDFGLDDISLAVLLPGKAKVDRDDVEAAIRALVQAHKLPSRPLAAAADSPAAAPRREPLGTMRKRIAERMMLSTQTSAPVTLTTEIDATELVRLREALKNDPTVVSTPSYNVLIAKTAARALLEHPALNASIDANEIVYWPSVNIGLAVDTPRGLVVPVVRDVDTKPVGPLADEIGRLVDKVLRGEATSEDLTGGTFTITNLGVQDIDAFTPIINPPQCAVLGVGRLRKKMAVINDEPVVRTMMVLSLTFDHRLVDGAPAARFLQRVKELLEKPYLWIL